MKLDDVGHIWGEDLRLTNTGDLSRVSGLDRSKERVLRRLLTVPGFYLSHREYGAGLPREVGQLVQKPRIYSLIRGQMKLEASVSQTPGPRLSVDAITTGISANIAYTAEPGGEPVALSFDLEA